MKIPRDFRLRVYVWHGHHQFVPFQLSTQMNTLQALSYLRPLKRQTSEHVFLASDGNSYAVDLDETWGNESSMLNALGGRLCQFAGIETGAPALLNVDPEALKTMAITPYYAGGVFLGKRFPVDPATSAIYDFFPDSLLPMVENRGDFWKLIPIDLWFGNPQASKVLFYRTVPQLQSYRGAIVFRSATESILQRQPCRAAQKLPLLAVRHYCGAGGYESAERTAAQLFAMNASDLEGLLDDLPGNPIERCVAMTGSVAKVLVATRDTMFRDFSAKLREMQHRVDAAENDRKGPHSEVACADVAGSLNRTLGVSA